MTIRLAKIPVAILIACAMLAVAVMGGYSVAAHSPWLHRVLIRRANTILERRFPGLGVTIRWDRLHWEPWSAIELEGVELRLGDRAAARGDRLRLSCHWSSQRPYVMVDKVYLYQADIRVEVDEHGHWVMPASRQAGGAGRATEAAGSMAKLPLVYLEDARIEVRRASRGILVLRGVSGVLRLERIRGPHGAGLRLHLGG